MPFLLKGQGLGLYPVGRTPGKGDSKADAESLSNFQWGI
jgi:hypothetical protein